MITDKFIKGYAVLKSEWFGKNIIDEYIPFIATTIIENEMIEIDETTLNEKLNDKYPNVFQESFVRQILSQAVNKGAIINNRGKFVVNKEEIAKYAIRMESFDFDFELLINDFIEYAKNRRYFPSKESISKLILEFVDKYDDRVLYNNVEDLPIDNNIFLYHWCNYIIELKNSNTKLSEFFTGLCFGNLVKNALFYANDEKYSFSNLTLYLDTPMIFALMGMDTPERQSSFRTLLSKATKIGMNTRIFDQNFEEAKGIMERASRWVSNGNYDSVKANKVSQFFYESGMSSSEMTEYIHDFEAQLNSLGITKEETNYLAEEHGFQVDEQKLFDAIKSEYGRRALKYNSEAEYDNTIKTDVRSLVMIQRKRAGSYSTDLNSAKCVFLTTNGVLAKVSKDYTLNDECTKDKIPASITVDIFGTLLWMNYPEKNEYIGQKLIADCKALLKVSPQMIAKFNIELDKAYDRRDTDLTEEKFLFLRSHPIVQRYLLDATSGDYSQFDSNTWRKVYDRIVSSAQYAGEKKYEEEKTKHEATKSELEKAQNVIYNQTEKEQDLNNEIIQQRDSFSKILARITAITIYAIPYIVLSLVVIFVQNSYVDWTVRGICLGALTIIIGILLPIFYKKLENALTKAISKRFEAKK